MSFARRISFTGAVGLSLVAGCHPSSTTTDRADVVNTAVTSKGDFNTPPKSITRDEPKRDPLPKRKNEEVSPRADAEMWLARVKESRLRNPTWMPPVESDPRLVTEVTHCRFKYVAFQVLDGEKMLIRFGDETLLLYANVPDAVDGRSYTIDGLFKPAERYRYVDTIGSTRTVQAVMFCCAAPDLPPVERPVAILEPEKTKPETKPEPKPESKTEPKPEPEKKVEAPPVVLPKVTLTPPENGFIILGGSRLVIDNAAESERLRTKWEEEGGIILLTKPTEVEVVSRDRPKKLCRVKLDGKEWAVDAGWVPAEKK